MTETSNPPLQGYLPTLDGWRAVAIVLVLLTHDRVHRVSQISTEAIHTSHGRGQGGVELFFCISGVLICTRLLEEERLNGTICLKNFYLRRGFRIQPAAWVYLGFIAVLMATGVLTAFGLNSDQLAKAVAAWDAAPAPAPQKESAPK